MRLAIVACLGHPDLSASNALFRRALERKGAEVEVVTWNATPVAHLAGFDLCVLRQSWDYQDDPAGFAAWACGARRAGVRLANPAEMAIWNNDKRTLAALQEIGVAVPWMMRLDAAPPAPAELPEQLVIKPAFGGSGVGVRLCPRDAVTETRAEAEREPRGDRSSPRRFCRRSPRANGA